MVPEGDRSTLGLAEPPKIFARISDPLDCCHVNEVEAM